jgi:hypothetical protein
MLLGSLLAFVWSNSEKPRYLRNVSDFWSVTYLISMPTSDHTSHKLVCNCFKINCKCCWYVKIGIYASLCCYVQIGFGVHPASNRNYRPEDVTGLYSTTLRMYGGFPWFFQHIFMPWSSRGIFFETELLISVWKNVISLDTAIIKVLQNTSRRQFLKYLNRSTGNCDA